MFITLNQSDRFISINNKIGNNKKSQRFQKGLSLIEASMVLVLSAVVVAGVMTYYESAEENNKLNDTTNMVMHVMSEVNGMYAAQPRSLQGTPYKKFDNTTLKTYVHDLKFDSNHKIKIPFADANMEVGAAVPDSTGTYHIDATADAFAYAIQLNKVPMTLCQKVNGMDFGQQLIEIDNNVVDSAGAAVTNGSMVIKPTSTKADVLTKCDALFKAVTAANTNDAKLNITLVLK